MGGADALKYLSYVSPISSAAAAEGPPKGEPTFADYDRSMQLRESLGALTDQLKSLNDKLGQRPDALGDQKQGATFDERFGGGATFDERFGPTSPPEPRSYPQKSSWRDWTAPIPTETIDRAALYGSLRGEQTHRVEGNASLTVDVNAPPGTQVNADADDFFHPVTISRQMQMEPAGSTAYRRSVIGPV
jgi:hypothetical protein